MKGFEMLVLTRKIGERILIDGNIELIVLRVSGAGIRLGFNAPANVAIVRDDARRAVPDCEGSQVPTVYAEELSQVG